MVCGDDPEPASEGTRLLAAAIQPPLLQLYRNRVGAAEDAAPLVMNFRSSTKPTGRERLQQLSRRTPKDNGSVESTDAFSRPRKRRWSTFKP